MKRAEDWRSRSSCSAVMPSRRDGEKLIFSMSKIQRELLPRWLEAAAAVDGTGTSGAGCNVANGATAVAADAVLLDEVEDSGGSMTTGMLLALSGKEALGSETTKHSD